MITDTRAWPEGVTFSKVVELPVQGGLIEVAMTYRVPPFETLVALHENRDQSRAYPIFRQFIVDWDLQEKLTDHVLIHFLQQDTRVSEVMFAAWADHMKEHILAHQANVMQAPATIN